MIFALLVAVALGSEATRAQPVLGARGEEGEPSRRQQWLVPSLDPARPARAFLFRPPGAGPLILRDHAVVIGHSADGWGALALGHWLPESESGVKLATAELDRALRAPRPAAAKKP
ncbi:hypothetical protein [Bradyrhizobium cenepequi]